MKKLVEVFIDNAGRQPFNENDLAETVVKGKKALRGYYKHYIKNWNRNVVNEFKVTVLLPVDIKGAPRLKLRGDLDKVEFLSGHEVNVVDYKTGKPKSRNVIEGKTKSSDGNYKRQLVFYNLLLNLYEGGKSARLGGGFRMVSGDIDFVEPDGKGRYHKEKFVVTDGEVSKLKKIIEDTAQEILSLSFWNTDCGNKGCQYCALRHMMYST